MSRPFVSCITPTYGRALFLPNLLKIFNYQTYPANLMELIILDDSPESNQHIIDKYNVNNNIKYTHLKEKLPLGKKRNMLNDMATGDYIVCFDDDDYYPPERVSHAITKMTATKNNLSGASLLYVYFTHLDQIYAFGPYGPNHATNGTFAYNRSFLQKHKYEDNAKSAEEAYFLEKYTNPLVQLDPFKTILCIAHNSNTFDKKQIMSTGKLTSLKLKSFVKDKQLLDFYKKLKSP